MMNAGEAYVVMIRRGKQVVFKGDLQQDGTQSDNKELEMKVKAFVLSMRGEDSQMMEAYTQI